MKNTTLSAGDSFEFHNLNQNIGNLEAILGNWGENRNMVFEGLTLEQEIEFLEQTQNELQLDLIKNNPSVDGTLFIGNAWAPYPPRTDFEIAWYSSNYQGYTEQALQKKRDNLIVINHQIEDLKSKNKGEFSRIPADYRRLKFRLELYRRRLEKLLVSI